MGLGVALVVTGVVLINSIGPLLILAGLGALAGGVGLARRGHP